MTQVLLRVSRATHDDIRARIEALGPLYVADFLRWHQPEGLVIQFGEVGLVVDRTSDSKNVSDVLFLLRQLYTIEHEQDTPGIKSVAERYNWEL